MRLLWSLLLTVPTIASILLGESTVVLAQIQRSNPVMRQVTSVSQLSDVQPTDWAFQALQSLVERYGCIAGYPDGTYRGSRPMTRYEFAAGLNACMDRVNELIASATADLVTKEDLETLRRLQEEFAAELATLRGRVDALEARTTKLEAQQFSTTTKLNGEAIFAVAGVATGQESPGVDIPRSTTLGYRARLNFDTSFTGRDLLRTRLQSINLNYIGSRDALGLPVLTAGDLRFGPGAYGIDGTSQVFIDALLYSFPVGDKLNIVLEGNAGATDDFASTVNPFIDGDGATGAVSNFATRNSIYYYVAGSGAAARYQFNDALELSLGYLAPLANSPRPGEGLFNGAYGAIAQLLVKPSDRFQIAFSYINAYNSITGTGSTNSNLFVSAGFRPVVTNSYGVQASFQVSPNFVVNGWAGYTAGRVIGAGDAEIWTYALALAFPDIGKEGNLAGIIIGQEPRLTGTSASLRNNLGLFADRDTALHVEGFFTYQVSDNIGITPAIIWNTAPNHNEQNADLVLGVLRTTFVF
ncbi:MAG: iron uptake porin [Leptolyngbyaceae cyanobacterium bins.59]|nr:iron uptake porin [Leptolyngbyaceae cyanobacterium bins.59]